ncbi:MAG: M28 family peptidase [bacterium]
MTPKLLLLLLVTVLSSTAVAGDLYKVDIGSHSDAKMLSRAGVDVLLKVDGSYLVIVDNAGSSRLNASGLISRPIASGVTRPEVAMCIHHERSYGDQYPLLYENGLLQLYRIDPTEIETKGWPVGLIPIMVTNLPVTYREPRQIDLRTTKSMVDLDSLVGLLSEDSCRSYVERLEAFNGRLVGTDSNYASRDWLIGKLNDFGYDSVYTDTFNVINFWEPTPVHSLGNNVIATKVGSMYPLHQIVVGGHRDAFPYNSPGADDNGSGTGAVLEMARILKNIDTRLTFVFVLFDAEEPGLWGAWHYAHQARQRGDSIVLVLNLDCISYYENTDLAWIYQDAGDPFGQLWNDLADSLSLGITAGLQNTGAVWDGKAFDQYGFPTVSLGEDIYPWGIHTAHDSTVYCDFNYMARISRASLAMVYVTDADYTPDPLLLIDYPYGAPQLLLPGSPETVEVEIDMYAGAVLLADSCRLHYAIDGSAYTSIPMSNVSGNLFSADIPAFTCESRLEYYVSAKEIGGSVFYKPDSAAPIFAAAGTEMAVIFEDNFETYQGWAVMGDATRGMWGRRDAGGYGYSGQAAVDFDGSGMCYSTGPEEDAWAAIDVDEGTTILRSPPWDLSSGQALIEYARWYCNSTGGNPFNDIFRVYVSNNNGMSWLLMETVGPVYQASGGWFLHRFWLNDVIAPSTQVRLCFGASDLGGESTVEAAIDAVKITLFSCGPDVEITTEALPDWTAGLVYAQQLEHIGGYGQITWTDKYNDLVGTGLTLSATGLVAGTTVAGTVSFTAVATDEIARNDETELTFQVNPQLQITTTDLPDADQGVAYSEQLQADGGTGMRSWSDRDGNLAGTGLTLATDGLLSGIPTDTGTISFVAQVADSVGATAEQLYDLHVGEAYICGDIDGNSSVDVGDLTFLVAYLFQGGPPPPVPAAADVDGSGAIDVGDLTSLVAYLFGSIPELNCL